MEGNKWENELRSQKETPLLFLPKFLPLQEKKRSYIPRCEMGLPKPHKIPSRGSFCHVVFRNPLWMARNTTSFWELQGSCLRTGLQRKGGERERKGRVRSRPLQEYTDIFQTKRATRAANSYLFGPPLGSRLDARDGTKHPAEASKSLANSASQPPVLPCHQEAASGRGPAEAVAARLT